MRLSAGDRRIQELTTAFGALGCEFLNPVATQCARLDQDRIRARTAKCSVLSEPDIPGRVVIRYHAQNDLGSRCRFSRRISDERPGTGEGNAFFTIAVIDRQWKARGEQTMRHTRAHDAESENCDAWFWHSFTQPRFTHPKALTGIRAGFDLSTRT